MTNPRLQTVGTPNGFKMFRKLVRFVYNKKIMCILLLGLMGRTVKAENPKQIVRHKVYGYDPADIHLPKNPTAPYKPNNYYYNQNCRLPKFDYYNLDKDKEAFLCKCMEFHNPQHRSNYYKSDLYDEESLRKACEVELERNFNNRDFSTYLLLNKWDAVPGVDIVMLLDRDWGYKKTYHTLSSEIIKNVNDNTKRLHFVGLRISIYLRDNELGISKVLDFTGNMQTVSDTLKQLGHTDSNKYLLKPPTATGKEIQELKEFLLPTKHNPRNGLEAFYYEREVHETSKISNKIPWRIGARRLLLMTNPQKEGYFQLYYNNKDLAELFHDFHNWINNEGQVKNKSYKYYGECSVLSTDTLSKHKHEDDVYEDEDFYKNHPNILYDLGDVIASENITIINILSENSSENQKGRCNKLEIHSPTLPDVLNKVYNVTSVEFLFSVADSTLDSSLLSNNPDITQFRNSGLDMMKFLSINYLKWPIFGGLLQKYLYDKSQILMTSIPCDAFNKVHYDYISKVVYRDFGPLPHHFTDSTRVMSAVTGYKEDFRYLYDNNIKEKFLKDRDVLGQPTTPDSIIYQMRNYQERYAPYEYYYPDKFKFAALPKNWPSYRYRNYYELFGESDKLMKTNFGHNLRENVDYHLVRPSKKKLDFHDLDTGSCSVFNVSSLLSDSRIINDAYLTSNFHYNEPPALKHKFSYVPHRRGLYEHKNSSLFLYGKYLDQMPSHYGRLAMLEVMSSEDIKSIFNVRKRDTVDFDKIDDEQLLGEALLHPIDFPSNVHMSNNDVMELIAYFTMRAHHLVNLPEQLLNPTTYDYPYSVLIDYLRSGKEVFFEPFLVIPYSRMKTNRSIFKPKQKGICPYFGVVIKASHTGSVTGYNGIPDLIFSHIFNPSACFEGTDIPYNDFYFHLQHEQPLSYYWKTSIPNLRVLNLDQMLDFRFNNLPNIGNLYYNYVALNHNRGNPQILPVTQFDYMIREVISPVEDLYDHTKDVQSEPFRPGVEHARRFYSIFNSNYLEIQTKILDATNAGVEKHLLHYVPLLAYNNERYPPVPSRLDYYNFVKDILRNRDFLDKIKLQGQWFKNKKSESTSMKAQDNSIKTINDDSIKKTINHNTQTKPKLILVKPTVRILEPEEWVTSRAKPHKNVVSGVARNCKLEQKPVKAISCTTDKVSPIRMNNTSRKQ